MKRARENSPIPNAGRTEFDSSEEEEIPAGKGNQDLANFVAETLTCPICKSCFRPDQKVWTCENGHYACETCRPKLPHCAVCRQGPIKYRICSLQGIAVEASKYLNFPCRWRLQGCEASLKSTLLNQHERLCSRRVVGCPGKYGKSCQWSGSLLQIMEHATQEKCMAFLKIDEAKELYRMDLEVPASFTDPNQQNPKTFQCHKPCVLVHPGMASLFVYLSCTRTPAGWWYLFCRAIASQEELDRAKVEISVKHGATRELEGQGEAFDSEPLVHRRQTLQVVPHKVEKRPTFKIEDIAVPVHSREIETLRSGTTAFRCEVKLEYTPPTKEQGAEEDTIFTEAVENTPWYWCQ